MYFTRKLTYDDAGNLFRITSNPEVTKYLGFRTHRVIDDARELIAAYAKANGYWFGVFDGLPWAERLVGVAGYEKQGHSIACALYFSPLARGAGRRFAAPWVRELFFQNSDIKRIWAHCHVDNVQVQRVMERMGAVREGRMAKYAVFPNTSEEPQDCYLYAITS